MSKPLILMILDGWGLSPRQENNAIALANPPVMNRLCRDYPFAELQASGMAVGLPEGQMGNSEVGHLNIGAGRIVYQDLTRITKAIDDGSFFRNSILLDCLEKTRTAGGRIHLAGLLSDGGVHSHNTHLYALLQLAKREGIKEVFVHCFLDGRDTPPKSALEYVAALEEEMKTIGAGRIATVMGRYYAMDRDNRWDRVEQAYNAMALGEGVSAENALAAIQENYDQGINDEFVIPTVICDQNGPVGTIRDGDGCIFFNFRSDRAREITRAFTAADFTGFSASFRPAFSSYVCLTEYDETFGLPVAFAPEELKNILGEVLSNAGFRQLRIAETEKYAHVTFFFNGGNEAPFPGEERLLIPSPKDVATYDLKPEMSVYKVTAELVERLDGNRYDFIVLNFANPDMVGHTGFLDSVVKAITAVDECVGVVVDKVLSLGGSLLITADHGNAESMVDENGNPHTAHTCNPVPLVLVGDAGKGLTLRSGVLADIAPTVLEILGVPKPAEMTGSSLLVS
ncbi:MAG: 2,3-bisphosphoglycerate-independent phosphoglycerate mutase [Deltaproteobacteria bacterium]|nr:2,3-bisphosphoglycerate-independent phosphoglycerate mutase [Deltaproteobacteria bacterium]TLN01688.1 MAG: 2,3-bisphosphoglycerate-independent phosphoglycerate mutase [bacterium]